MIYWKNLFLLIFIIFFGCKNKNNYIYPERKNIVISIYASGTVLAEDQYTIYSEISGKIKEIIIKEGEYIGKKQVFIILENKFNDYETKNLKEQINFISDKNSENSSTLLQLKYQLDELKKQLAIEEKNYAYQKDLFEKKIISRNNFDNYEIQYTKILNQNKITNQKYIELKKQLEYEKNIAINNYNKTRNKDIDYEISSITEGKIYKIFKRKGEFVKINDPIAVVGSANDFYVELDIDEEDVFLIKENYKIIFTLDAYPDNVFEGTIRKIYPYLNVSSQTFKVEGNFNNKPNILFPNMSVNANIIAEDKKDVLLIPLEYLIDNEYVITENNQKLMVKIGKIINDKVEILNFKDTTIKIFKPKS